ncbi:hypothetical protein [Paeniglutamicibacter cryotolerans]|uniref:Uncharacterized protein n=1 Tax=Paeniglutamicibacter cryotolerans TaxID=670079 RepID=A0A839QMS5_9MICC|nr:hypothetical protein [Paeniglutamicibacter cryotolerans]MBB2997197.1 hypothetical protein [Paeniglutamicibacter cryotolerans]
MANTDIHNGKKGNHRVKGSIAATDSYRVSYRLPDRAAEDIARSVSAKAILASNEAAEKLLDGVGESLRRKSARVFAGTRTKVHVGMSLACPANGGPDNRSRGGPRFLGGAGGRLEVSLPWVGYPHPGAGLDG